MKIMRSILVDYFALNICHQHQIVLYIKKKPQLVLQCFSFKNFSQQKKRKTKSSLRN